MNLLKSTKTLLFRSIRPFCEVPLLNVQTNKIYERAMKQVIDGQTEQALSALESIKEDYEKDAQTSTFDYEHLLKKIVTLNRMNESPEENRILLDELFQISFNLRKNNFSELFNEFQFVLKEKLAVDPSEAIDFVKESQNKAVFPHFLKSLLDFYLGVRF